MSAGPYDCLVYDCHNWADEDSNYCTDHRAPAEGATVAPERFVPTEQMFQHVPVQNMLPGDRFLTNRSGVVTAVSHPYADPAGGSGRCIQVLKENGETFELVGVNRYTVYRTVVVGRHKRLVQQLHRDPSSLAVCKSDKWDPCSNDLCPEHDPEGYADSMARHATDSITPNPRVKGQWW